MQIEDFGLQNQSRDRQGAVNRIAGTQHSDPRQQCGVHSRDREGAVNRPGGASENSPGSPAGLQKAAAGGLNRPGGVCYDEYCQFGSKVEISARWELCDALGRHPSCCSVTAAEHGGQAPPPRTDCARSRTKVRWARPATIRRAVAPERKNPRSRGL